MKGHFYLEKGTISALIIAAAIIATMISNASGKKGDDTFYPIRDATTLSNQPNWNYGDNIAVFAANFTSPSKTWFAWMTFDTTTLKEYKRIREASLNLHVAACSSGVKNVSVYKASDDWIESVITWNNQPAIDSAPFTILGASALTWISSDIKEKMAYDSDGEFTIVVKIDYVNAGSCSIDSRETFDTEYKPHIDINYIVAGGVWRDDRQSSTPLLPMVSALFIVPAAVALSRKTHATGTLIRMKKHKPQKRIERKWTGLRWNDEKD